MSIEEPYGPYNPAEDDPDEYHTWLRDLTPARTYFDDKIDAWVCLCRKYLHTGKCTHVYRHKSEKTVNVSDDYL